MRADRIVVGKRLLCLLALCLCGAAAAQGVAMSARLVQHIRITGNTVFDEATLHALAAPYENRLLAVEQMEDLRQRLTRFYIDAGYINSGAVIPEQPLAGGTLEVRIVEGRLSQVRISGEHHYSDWYLPRLINAQPEKPLNVNELQERVQLLLQDGVVAQINAQLAPGDAPGQSILNAVVREGPRFSAGFTVDDQRPPSVGETGGSVSLGARNLLGIGDQSGATFGLTPGYLSYGVQETLPLLPPTLSLFARFDKDHGSIVESSIAELGITSRETSVEVGLSAQLLHTLRNNATVSISGYYTDTATFLLGIPFSFTPGVVDGHSRVAALRYALDWATRGKRSVFAAHAAVDFGVRAFGATEHADSSEPDSRFAVLNGQLQYIRQVWGSAGEVVGRASFQLASRGLLPSEKYSVGGADTVRGYAANLLVRDEGATASAEYRHTVFHLRLPGVSHDLGDGALALAAFYDAGMANDRYGERVWISGVGGGLRWTPASNCSLLFYKGVALHRVGEPGSSLQAQGIHFKVSYEAAF